MFIKTAIFKDLQIHPLLGKWHHFIYVENIWIRLCHELYVHFSKLLRIVCYMFILKKLHFIYIFYHDLSN